MRLKIVRLISMYELGHCFRIVDLSFFFFLNSLRKAFQKGLAKYDYTL